MTDNITPEENYSAPEASEVSANNTSVDDEIDPQSAARGRMKQKIVISILVFLLIASITIVVFNSPFDSQPVAKKASEEQFVLNRMTQVLTRGMGGNSALQYSAIQEKVSYQVFVQEENQYAQGEAIKTEIQATVIFEPGKSGNDQSIYVHLENTDVTVFDGNSPRNVDGLGKMIDGIILEGRLNPEMGLGKLVPIVKINPQVGRVLYTVLDMVRYAWIPLPNGEIGMGGQWQTIYKTIDGETVVLHSVLEGPEKVRLTISHKSGEIEDGRGNGELRIANGRPQELHGSLNSELKHEGADSVGKHKVAFSVKRIAVVNQKSVDK